MSSTEKATRCMPISLGRVGVVSIASGWMYSNSSMRPLPSGVWSMAMLAWLPSSPTAVSVHSPLTVSRPRTVRPRSVKKGMASSRSRTAMPTFSSLISMRARFRDAGPVQTPGFWWELSRAKDRHADQSAYGRPLSHPLAVVRMREVMRRGFSRQGQLEIAAPLPHRSADDAEQELVSPLATDIDGSRRKRRLHVHRDGPARARLTSACGVAPPVRPNDQSDTDHDDPQPEQRVTNAPEPRRPDEPGNDQAETGNHNPR